MFIIRIYIGGKTMHGKSSRVKFKDIKKREHLFENVIENPFLGCSNFVFRR